MHFVKEPQKFMAIKKIKIEVCYATPTQQKIFVAEVDSESTIETAIKQSGILEFFPEINLATQKVGIFSQIKKLTDIVQENNRIEIYRPLLIDPKEARRKRVV